MLLQLQPLPSSEVPYLNKVKIMLRNYLLITLRTLKKQKLFSLINILGLTIGMTTSVMILMWVQDELSYDNFHEDLDQIYRVYEYQTYSGDQSFPTYSTPGALAPALIKDYPEIVASTQFSRIWSNVVFNYQNKIFNEGDGYFAGQDVFKIFRFEFLAGQAEGALTRPHTMVINRSLAQRYFGSDWKSMNVIGENIQLSNNWQYEITGVVEDYPSNSIFNHTFLVPFESLGEMWDWDTFMEWGSNYTETYVRLEPGADPQALDRKITEYIKERNEGSVVDLFLYPFSKSYLHRLSGGGRIQYVRIFSAIAIFILIIACINFMNLATAKSGIRSKEVGIRKSIGAHKNHLVTQFLFESMAMAVISLVLTILAIHLLLPSFNDLTGKTITVDYTAWTYIVVLITITLLTGIIAGSYPAFYISSFKPTDVLKGLVQLKGATLRKGLVILQFSLSVILIVSTIVVNKQLFHIQNQEIGYQKENIIYFEISDDFSRRYPLLKHRFLQIPEVANVSASQQLPVDVGNSTSNVQWPGKDPNDVILINVMRVEYDYINTMKMELVEGRDFSTSFASDSTNYLVNETFAQMINEEGALNTGITMWEEKGNIVGVVKDFNFRPLSDKIDPMIFRCDPEIVSTVTVRLKGGHFNEITTNMEVIWKDINPDLPFEFHFLDKQFDDLYQAEIMTGKLFNIFSGLAIFISCLGLFGLAAFTAEQMKKEIGIRKVLGASVQGIVFLFSKIFTKWVVISNLIALPIAYFITEKWLEDYAYRIYVNGWMLAGASAVSLLIALSTIIYQSLRTAVSNPVDALRSE